MSIHQLGSILFLLAGALYAPVGSGACDAATERWVVDDAHGVVTDAVTGLTWMRCAVGQLWQTGRCVDAPQWFSWHSWAEAVQSAGSVRHGGFSDWRLPSIDELESLVSQCARPAIDARAFPGAPAALFWSATPSRDNDEYAWRVDFASGRSNADLKRSVSYRVRLVRGARWSPLPPSPPSPESVQTGDAGTPPPTVVHAGDLYDQDSATLALLQPAAHALSLLPQTEYGNVDWGAALRTGAIAPRSGLDAAAGAAEPFDLTIVMKNTAGMGHVSFPHRAHLEWLTCSNCHPAIFAPKVAANPITMGAILRGEYCGRCHGRVAFSTLECDRCHLPPQTEKTK